MIQITLKMSTIPYAYSLLGIHLYFKHSNVSQSHEKSIVTFHYSNYFIWRTKHRLKSNHTEKMSAHAAGLFSSFISQMCSGWFPSRVWIVWGNVNYPYTYWYNTNWMQLTKFTSWDIHRYSLRLLKLLNNIDVEIIGHRLSTNDWFSFVLK